MKETDEKAEEETVGSAGMTAELSALLNHRRPPQKLNRYLLKKLRQEAQYDFQVYIPVGAKQN